MSRPLEGELVCLLCARAEREDPANSTALEKHRQQSLAEANAVHEARVAQDECTQRNKRQKHEHEKPKEGSTPAEAHGVLDTHRTHHASDAAATVTMACSCRCFWR
jgi:hypothetical protein